MELEKRLGLYQVFLKIYEHNHSLLDEILQLENSSFPYLGSKVPTYVEGVVQNGEAYIITNLVNGKTQKLLQPQRIWLIGRDRRLTLRIKDQWISRQHAAIQYVENEGFYLVDLSSTNGSFVNSEPVFQRQLLEDGDQIRLGSSPISFFLAQTSEKLEPVSPEIVAQLNSILPVSPPPTTEKLTPVKQEKTIPVEDSSEETCISTRQQYFCQEPTSSSCLLNLTATQRSEILDRFLNSRQTSVEQK